MSSQRPYESEAESDTDQPSKSQRRRDALAVLDLAGELASLKKSALKKLPISATTAEALLAVNGIRARVARKRQLHFAAKCLRQENLEALHSHLEGPGPEQARSAHLERWANYLLHLGLPAVEVLVAAVPHANRQTLRQAVLATQRLTEEQIESTGHQLILKSLDHLGEIDVDPPAGAQL